MGNLYYPQLTEVLVAAGVQVGVNDINEGWERRSRSSGGFDAPPLGIVWHHTASSASVNSDLNYMINGSPDEPVGNLLLDRAGIVWPIAAGAANTQGKGGPESFSRGTVPVDQGNTRLWAMEVANNGVGEPWPQQQIDAYFTASNAINAMFGNQPTDIVSHHEWAPSRKIDPAVAASVQGPWQPRSINSSGTWNFDDVRNEAMRRAAATPEPPTPEEDEEMAFIMHNRNTGEIALVYGDGIVTGLAGGDLGGYVGKFGEPIDTDPVVWADFLRKSPR
jgi:hypothetical protein